MLYILAPSLYAHLTSYLVHHTILIYVTVCMEIVLICFPLGHLFLCHVFFIPWVHFVYRFSKQMKRAFTRHNFISVPPHKSANIVIPIKIQPNDTILGLQYNSMEMDLLDIYHGLICAHLNSQQLETSWSCNYFKQPSASKNNLSIYHSLLKNHLK